MRNAGAKPGRLADGEPPQWLPAAEHHGFYYALIEKQA
jgi:hypothetical protein